MCIVWHFWFGKKQLNKYFIEKVLQNVFVNLNNNVRYKSVSTENTWDTQHWDSWKHPEESRYSRKWRSMKSPVRVWSNRDIYTEQTQEKLQHRHFLYLLGVLMLLEDTLLVSVPVVADNSVVLFSLMSVRILWK